ncbi:MAG: 1-deoxy-D-xylulose-5-phosphate reductoisomerase, partial [Flavobacteriales bacterium]
SLEVIEKNKEKYEVACLVALSNIESAKAQAKRHKKAKIYIEKLEGKLTSERLINKNDLLKLISSNNVDTVVAAISGSDGFELIHHSILSGKKVLIANKEPLVMAGEFIVNEAKKHGAQIIPIDSEHCAIHQIINGRELDSISKIILTCSGGPFHSLPRNKFKAITKNQALNHPVWKMGKKITIDSSTLMNKALEIIEAKFLFGVNHKKIEAIIHPESLIHSFVEFDDGTILASMAKPDMKIPISYGLSYPKIFENGLERIDISMLSELTFKKIDRIKFPSLDFAYFAIEAGKGMPIFLNAANEVAVNHFLMDNIKFLDIYRLISEVLDYADKNNIKLNSVTLDAIQDFNEEAIKISNHLSKQLIK